MTEEEYFRKNFPDSCYGDKPLSPHWDYFQYGVEFGEQESEKQIKELEQKLEQTEKDLADYQFNCPTIKELQKENADLKEEINKIAFARGNLEEENAELKELIEKYRQAVDKCLHITFMGAGCEVNTIGQYATLVDGYLTDVEGLAKWKN